MPHKSIKILNLILFCLGFVFSTANAGIDAPNYIQKGSTLTDVACDQSGRQCNAVGSYFQATTLKLFPLSVTSGDSSRTWITNVSFPLPSDIDSRMLRGARLAALSCDNTGQLCVSVGAYDSVARSAQSPLAYTTSNGGLSWLLSSAMPLPNNQATNMSAGLTSVRCDNTRVLCTAVGMYTNTAGHDAPLSYISLNGGLTWQKGGAFLLPQDITSTPYLNDELKITSVTCDNTGFKCSTVGSYINTQRRMLPLGYTTLDGGRTWLLSPPFPQYNTMHTTLSGIACDVTGSLCTAVGEYVNASNQVVPLAYVSSNGGQSWLLSAPLPVPNYAWSASELLGVTCNATGSRCVAVGQHKLGETRSEPLSYTSTDGGYTWTLGNKLILPNGSDANVFRARLNSVACDTTGFKCTAVGQYMTNEKYVALSYTSINGGETWVLNKDIPGIYTHWKCYY